MPFKCFKSQISRLWRATKVSSEEANWWLWAEREFCSVHTVIRADHDR